jgi:hypothetical protein
MTKVNYNRSEWIHDLFPDGDAPRTMSEDYWNNLKERHKEMMKERELEEQRINELKQKEYEKAQQHKNTIQYSDKLAQEICERVSAGELLLNICDDYHMPTLKRCNMWLKTNPDFATLFNQAIQDRLSIFEEEVIRIADDITNDFKEITIKNVKKRVIDPEVIARAKLRIDVRFRHLKAGRPSKWGDTSTLITKNDDVDDPTNFTNEELERRIADIENKDRIIKSAK